MQSLAARTCVPCRGGTPPMRSDEIAPLRPFVPQWEVAQEKKLCRTFRFKDFVTALDFVNRIGALAEEQGHHPDLCFGWGKVEVTLLTHKIQGLTESDFIFAAKIDLLAETALGLKAQ